MNPRKILFMFYYDLRSKRSLEYLKKIEKSQYLSLEEIEKLQFTKMKNLLNYSYNNVPFYKKTFKNLNLTPDDIKSKEDIEKLPIITKDEINSNLNDLISISYSKNYLNSDSTGGSTGKNLNFYNDKKNMDLRQAFVLRGNKWAGLDMGVKNAYLWGSPLDLSAQQSMKSYLLNKINGSIFLSSFNLSDNQMNNYIKKLNQFRPEVIIGYPSVLFTFAKHISDNKIKIKYLNSIITSAENLFDFQREYIESIFECEIFDRYGCREFGPIAHECSEHDGLHINMEHVYLEFLDNNKEKTKGEKNSKIIITDLDNYAMPFIRYEIGDLGNLVDYSCDCNRNLPLMKVEGRSFDVIFGTNGNRLGGTFWTLLLRKYSGIEKFQINQKSSNYIQIKIITNENFDEKIVSILINEIKEYCGNDMIIDILKVETIKNSESGKFKFIINEAFYGKFN